MQMQSWFSRFRIPENASDQEIQDILKQVFNAQEGNVNSDSVDAEQILKQKIQEAVQEQNVQDQDQDQNAVINSVSVQYAVTKQIQDQDSRTVQFCMYSKGKIQIEDSLKQRNY